MRILDDLIINITTLATTNSEVVDISHEWMWSVHFAYTGTPTGTTSVQCSNDGVNWSDVVTGVAVSAAGNNMVNTPGNVGYKYIRAVYTHTSGSGTLKARVFAKGV